MAQALVKRSEKLVHPTNQKRLIAFDRVRSEGMFPEPTALGVLLRVNHREHAARGVCDLGDLITYFNISFEMDQ